MPDKAQAIIAELRQNKRFMGTCPSCGTAFRLATATMFSISDDPPADVLPAIESKREELQERNTAYLNRRERVTTGAERTAAAVNLGKIIEKIVPSFSTFSYRPGDCRALFEPIDYLIFPGLTGAGKVDALVFVDVKSGAARLTKREKNIKEVVDSGSIKFESHP